MAKAKGASLLGAVKWLRRSRETALGLLPPRLHHYLDERIQVASWYPEEDLLDLVRALARVLPAGQGDVYEQMGRVTARDQLAGVYRHLLEGGDALSLPRRGLVLWQSQHDSGRLQVTVQGPGRARVEVSDYGLPSREMCKILLGYTAEMFAIAELPNPRVEKTGCRLDGAAQCSWLCSWDAQPVVASAAGR
jgi:hypothetical protein